MLARGEMQQCWCGSQDWRRRADEHDITTYLSDFNTLLPRIKHDHEGTQRAFFVRVIRVEPHNSGA